jgi:hypothetical protein
MILSFLQCDYYNSRTFPTLDITTLNVIETIIIGNIALNNLFEILHAHLLSSKKIPLSKFQILKNVILIIQMADLIYAFNSNGTLRFSRVFRSCKAIIIFIYLKLMS